MKKALRIVSIAMPFVVLVLFFIPISTTEADFRDVSDFVEGDLYNVSTGSLYDACVGFSQRIDWLEDYPYATDNSIVATKSDLIYTSVFFVIAALAAVLVAVISQKRPLLCCLNTVPLAYFWIWVLAYFKGVLFKTVGFYTYTANAAFYISLILSAFFLAVFVAYAVKWLKSRFDSLPPREHKPTKAERIAELEARVRELENREPENRD